MSQATRTQSTYFFLQTEPNVNVSTFIFPPKSYEQRDNVAFIIEMASQRSDSAARQDQTDIKRLAEGSCLSQAITSSSLEELILHSSPPHQVFTNMWQLDRDQSWCLRTQWLRHQVYKAEDWSRPAGSVGAVSSLLSRGLLHLPGFFEF